MSVNLTWFNGHCSALLLKLLRKKKIGETQDKDRDEHPPLAHFSENAVTGDAIDKVCQQIFFLTLRLNGTLTFTAETKQGRMLNGQWERKIV